MYCNRCPTTQGDAVPSRHATFKAAIVLATFLVCAALVRFYPRSRPFFINPNIHVEEGKNAYQSDERLGFRSSAGTFHIRLTLPDTPGEWRFIATVGKDGNRVCGPRPPASPRREIWVFGCSCTWGWGVNDSETYPWLVQQRFPDYLVRNFAVSGYGQVQQLVQLEEALTKENKPPIVAVFTFNDYHLARNVVTPEWRAGFRVQNGLKNLRLLRARLDHDQLEIDTIPLEPLGPERNQGYSNPYMEDVACRLFAEIALRCRQHRIEMLLAV